MEKRSMKKKADPQKSFAAKKKKRLLSTIAEEVGSIAGTIVNKTRALAAGAASIVDAPTPKSEKAKRRSKPQAKRRAARQKPGNAKKAVSKTAAKATAAKSKTARKPPKSR